MCRGVRSSLRQRSCRSLSLDSDTSLALVAVLGTTISPYLFFWQASEEAEDEQADRAHRR